jgi:hypothetical protein
VEDVMRRILIRLGLLVSLLLLAGCAARMSTTIVAGASFKMGTFLYRDYSSDESLVGFVDVDLARNAVNRPFLPLYISVGNRGNRTAVVKVSSITLTTPSGRVLSASSYQAVRSSDYGRLYQDRAYLSGRSASFYGNDFDNMTRVNALFYPDMSYDVASAGYESVELARLTYFQSMLYFPSCSERGMYKLTIQTDVGAAVSISFPLFM